MHLEPVRKYRNVSIKRPGTYKDLELQGRVRLLIKMKDNRSCSQKKVKIVLVVLVKYTAVKNDIKFAKILVQNLEEKKQ